jgi:hypothetical protein
MPQVPWDPPFHDGQETRCRHARMCTQKRGCRGLVNVVLVDAVIVFMV